MQQSRKHKEKTLKRKKTSPLQKSDRRQFKKLNYFPVNPDYRMMTDYLDVEQKDTLYIRTSAGTEKLFVRYGYFKLDWEGMSDTLFGFKRVWPDGYQYDGEPYLFIPFNDLTNGEQTYGGGRYLDIPIPSDGTKRVELDFNVSYNPYCAYGSGFSCPIPPRENRLQWMILAGEKAYDHH